MRISEIKNCLDINKLIELHNDTYNEIIRVKKCDNFNYKYFRNKKQLFKIINNNIALILYDYDNAKLSKIAKNFNSIILRYFKSYYSVDFSLDILRNKLINSSIYSSEYSGFTRSKMRCKIKQPNCRAGYTREYLNYLNGLTFVNGELVQSSSIMAYNKKMIIAYNNKQSKNYNISNDAGIIYSSINQFKNSDLLNNNKIATVEIVENYTFF